MINKAILVPLMYKPSGNHLLLNDLSNRKLRYIYKDSLSLSHFFKEFSGWRSANDIMSRAHLFKVSFLFIMN